MLHFHRTMKRTLLQNIGALTEDEWEMKQIMRQGFDVSSRPCLDWEHWPLAWGTQETLKRGKRNCLCCDTRRAQFLAARSDYQKLALQTRGLSNLMILNEMIPSCNIYVKSAVPADERRMQKLQDAKTFLETLSMLRRVELETALAFRHVKREADQVKLARCHICEPIAFASFWDHKTKSNSYELLVDSRLFKTLQLPFHDRMVKHQIDGGARLRQPARKSVLKTSLPKYIPKHLAQQNCTRCIEMSNSLEAHRDSFTLAMDNARHNADQVEFFFQNEKFLAGNPGNTDLLREIRLGMTSLFRLKASMTSYENHKEMYLLLVKELSQLCPVCEESRVIDMLKDESEFTKLYVSTMQKSYRRNRGPEPVQRPEDLDFAELSTDEDDDDDNDF